MAKTPKPRPTKIIDKVPSYKDAIETPEEAGDQGTGMGADTDAQLSEEDEEALYPGAADGDDFTENEDGSVTFHDLKVTAKSNKEFYDNIVDDIDQSWLTRNASIYIEYYEQDKKSNEKNDEKYARGLQRAGAGEKAPGGADFAGASDVGHPLIMESSVEFASSCYKELFPADGPAKNKIIGKYGAKDVERSDRIRDFMNWQLTTQIEEFESTFDEMISQVPLAGSQYLRMFQDADKNRPGVEYIPSDKMLIPYSGSSLNSADRYMFLYDKTKEEVDALVAAGEFKDANYISSASEPEQTKTERATDKIQGIQQSGYNEDGLKTFADVYCNIDPEDNGKLSPYIMTLDIEAHEIVRIRRNWEENDKRQKRMDWIVEFPFVRWRGPRSLGLMHLIGDLGAAATGALRALLDSALVNNQSSALIIKGSSLGGQTQVVNAVGLQEIKAAPNIDDIRKQVMPFPFNPPSPTLFQLLGFLVESGKGVVNTASNAISDASSTMPVGTTLALIEQGGKNFSAIHKRLHKAMQQLLRILYRINKMYLTEEQQVDELDKLIVRPNDFRGSCTIVPVSDPNIFSDSQRFAQIQACWQLLPSCTDLMERRELLERTLRLLKVPDPEALLVKDKKPDDLNPVAENMAMALGQPTGVFPQQDHLAHIQAHTSWIENDFLASMYGPQSMAAFVEHLKQHIVMLYGKTCYDIASEAAGTPIDTLMHKDPETRNAFDQMMAVTAVKAQADLNKALEKVLPVIDATMKKIKEQMPPPPMDPTQAAMADIERQKAKDAQDGQLKGQEIQVKGQESQAKAGAIAAKSQADTAKAEQDAMIEQERLRIEKRNADQTAKNNAADQQLKSAQMEMDFNMEQRRVASEEMRNAEDNRTALTISAMKVVETKDNNKVNGKQSGDKNKVGNLKNGKSVTNPNP